MPTRRHLIVAGLAAALPLPAFAQSADSIGFENDLWRIDIVPQTLAVTVTAKGHPAISASSGVATHTVSDIVQMPSQASWTWDGQYHIACTLDGRDLSLGITAAQAGDLDIINQSGAAWGKGMMLPLAEGHYMPKGDATWQGFILEQLNGVNTTEDLSLPLWGHDHGAFTLHWLLTNPFNNTLAFSRDGDDLALKVTHGFTSLSPAAPMTLLLHLGAPDPVAGARRYRRHLIDTGAYETLAAKIAATLEGAKLIGATQVYLWGNGLFGEKDVTDWPQFLATLKGKSDLAVRLRATFDSDRTALLETVPHGPYEQRALAGAVSDGLNILARRAWQNDDADSETLVAAYPALRAQFTAAFGAALAPDPATWGQSFSADTVKALQGAGLQKLWVELGDGWEGGLWRPETVGDFVDAGYLIAPYDGYADAIRPGERPDWVNAQLGKAMFDTAGVMKKDGGITAGFVNVGDYTNTITVMPVLKSRVAALARATGFNSWYIDVNASGMVFDDYRPGHEMTMAQNARADDDGSRWIAETLGLPVASECGNAVTTGGIMTAQGMQSPGMGWGDPDLESDRTSPYFLGGWYPADQPDKFFRQVPAKPLYRTIYFAPQTRLPLYQSVFHGSIITTNHWRYDSLKFTDAGIERDLVQWLYNVPGCYHLSAATLAVRLPAVTRQDAVFRPLHKVLALKTMDGFAWLSDDRLVQMTTFSDGSRLIANFDGQARRCQEPDPGKSLDLPPFSLTALLAGRPAKVYRSLTVHPGFTSRP